MMNSRVQPSLRRAFALTLALLGLGAATSASAQRPPALDLAAMPPMSVAPADLLAFATARPAPADADLEYLFDSFRVAFDDEGRAVRTSHFVVRALTTRGADGLRTQTARYKPGFSAPPVIRARVISADGRVVELDPKTQSEQPVAAADDIYTDLRALTAPLPAVAPGSVVEILTETRDIALSYRSGVLQIAGLDATQPTRRLRVELLAPPALPLRSRVLGLPLPGGVTPKLTRSAAGTRLLLDYTPPVRPRALLDPPTAPSFAFVAVTTAASWAAVADEYAGLVTGALAAPAPDGADPAPALAALAAEVAGDAKDPDAIVARIHAWIAAKLRYTGIALGEAAWTPTPPLAVVARGYGDCKDLATLFVALARARGLQADLALVRSSRDFDPAADLPALGWFDHAIVALPGTSARWLDATASTFAPGHLPQQLAVRPVLVARRGETALQTLPAVAADDGWDEVREVVLAADGPGHLVEQTTARGAAAGRIRQWWKGTRADEQGGYWTSYAKSVYGDVTAARAEATGFAPATDPFVSTITLDGLASVALSRAEGTLELPFGGVLDALPESLREPFPAATPSERQWRDRWLARSVPLDLGRAERSSVTWRIVLPRGVAVITEPKLPPAFEVGPVRFDATYARDGQVVTVRYSTALAAAAVAPGDVAALHEAVRTAWASKMPQLTVGWAYDASVAAGDLAGAVKLAADVYAAEPEGLMPGVWFAQALYDAGLIEASANASRALAARLPKQPAAHLMIAQAAACDAVGRPYGRGFDRAGTLASLRASLALEPDNTQAHLQLVAALLRDAKGELQFAGDAAWADEILTELAWLAAHDQTAYGLVHAVVLISQRRYREAIDRARALPASKHRVSVGLTAVALADGVPAMLARVGEFGTAEAAVTRLIGAGVLAVDLGLDAVAAEIMTAASASAPADASVKHMATVYGRLVSDAHAPAGDPCLVARNFWGRHVAADLARLAPGLPAPYQAPHVLGAAEAGIGWSMLTARKPLRHTGATRDRVAVGLTSCEALPFAGRVMPVRLTVEPAGNARGARVYAVVLGPVKKGEAPSAVPAAPLFLGTEALQELQVKRVEEARRLLSVAFDAGVAGPIEPILSAWGLPREASALAGLDAQRLGVLAAVLAPAGPASKEAAKRLAASPERDMAPLVAARARAVAVAGSLPEAVGHVEALAALGEGAAQAAVALAGWIEVRRPADAQALVARLVAVGLEAELATLLELGLAKGHPDLASQRARFEALLATPGISEFAARRARNSLAWMALYDGHDLAAALSLIELTPERGRAEEHTRATLLAALGRSAEAVAALKASVPAGETPGDEDRLVLGRVAQSYGLPEVARWYYGQVAPDGDGPMSTRLLADRWTAELPAVPPSAATSR